MGGGPEIVAEASPDLKPDNTVSPQDAPGTEKCEKALPQPPPSDENAPPSDENVAKDNGSLENNQDTGDTTDQNTEEHTCCRCCHWSGALVTGEFNTQSWTPPGRRKRWWALWDESRFYSQPPWWHHGRRPRVPFKEWMFHSPLTRPITQVQLIAEIQGIYAGLVMVESKCIEVDSSLAARTLRHDIDVIPFLDATPCSVLIQLQRGGIDPEETIRNALQSSRERIKDAVKRLPWGGANGVFALLILRRAFAIRFMGLDLHVPTIEESLHGFLVAQEAHAKESGSPDYQALTDLTTKTIGNEGRANVAAGLNIFIVGRDILKAVNEGTEQAKHNIVEKTEKEAREAREKATTAEREAKTKAEQEAKTKAEEEEARRNTIHRVCECCGTPLCTHQTQTVVKAEKSDGVKTEQKVTLPELPADSRRLEDPTLYKKIGEVYYLFVNDRWMNISLKDKQYRALTALHTTDMHEMYDLFLASGHPTSTPKLKRLSAKYAMPARLWRHGIHAYLEALRLRLPESLDHMIAFMFRSYSMMQLMEETTNSRHFAIECAGDLARYRYAIEDEEGKVRLHWREVAIWQYSRTVDLDPTEGRPYNHIGISFRGSYTPQIFNMLKALTTSKPYLPAWHSMLSTFVGQFVAPEDQTSTKLQEALSLDEDNLFTAIACLVLASAPSENLKDQLFDTSKERHLLAFDRHLRLVAGLDDPKSNIPSKLLVLFQMSMGPHIRCHHRLGSILGWSGVALREIDLLHPREDGHAGHSPRDPWRICQEGKRHFFPITRPVWPGRKQAIPAFPRAGGICPELLGSPKNPAVADRAAQLLSVVNLRILARPVTNDVRLWEYLHVLLMFMRSLNTRPEMKKRFGYAFHPELMAPLLNLLLRRLKDRGGDAWEALFRPEFPTVWVPLNTKDKPEKYDISTAVAQREYCVRHNWTQEAESAMTDDTATGATSAKQEQAAEGTKDDLSTAQGVTAGDVVSESDKGFNAPVQEGLYTLVLPEDRLMRGFCFAKETPSPPEPERPPSEKQIAREEWEKKELEITVEKQNKARMKAARKLRNDDRKEQKRIARGADSKPQRHMCADCRILASRREVKAPCQARCGCHRVDAPEPESPTNTADGSVTGLPKDEPESNVSDSTKTVEGPPTITLDAAPADNRTADAPSEGVEASEVIPDGTQSTNWVAVDTEKCAVNDNKTITKATEPESDPDDPPHLGARFDEADEETVDENISTPENTTKPDDNAGVCAAFEEAEEAAATEDPTSPATAELESDYGIGAMLARADTKAEEAEIKVQEEKEARKEEEALRLDPYFYPLGFFEKSRLDWEESLVCRDYVQAVDMTNSRELRIVWMAVSQGSLFSFHMDKNGDYVIDVPGQRSVPQPYFDAQMPTIITRNDGSRVIYVDPTVEEIVAKRDALWEKLAASTGESETEGAQVEKPTNLHSSTQICSPTALGSSQEPCARAQENEGFKDVVADQAMEKNAPEVEPAEEKFKAAEEELGIAEDVKPGQDVEAVEEWSSVLGEPPVEAAKEAGVTTTSTQNAGVMDEPSVVASLPVPAGGVTQLTHTALADVPMRDEEDLDPPPKKRSHKSTEEWVDCQGEDGMGKKEGDNDDDEDSEGWTTVGGNPGTLGRRRQSLSSRGSFGADWAGAGKIGSS